MSPELCCSCSQTLAALGGWYVVVETRPPDCLASLPPLCIFVALGKLCNHSLPQFPPL